MKNTNKNKVSKLSNFFNISLDISDNLNDQILNLKLEPGQKLNKFHEEIPGVFFIEEGDIRLIGLNKKKEAFTVEKFSKNQIVGAEQILSGLKGYSISASTSVKGSLILKNNFLELVLKNKQFLEFFSSVKINELFCNAILNEEVELIDLKEILLWCKEFLKNKPKIRNLNDGDKVNADISNLFLVSSSNIEGFPPGSIINSQNKLKIKGEKL